MSSTFTSYFDTGYMTRAEGHKKQQSHYVTVYSKADEDFVVDSSGTIITDSSSNQITDITESGCQMFGKWDWAKDTLSNKWSASQQVYNSTDRPFRSVQRRKLKVRGTGATLQLRFNSEEGKPFHIIGWSTFDTANEKV